MDLKIFTLNCWGIPLVSKDRRPRMQAIAEVLATGNYDVVCLQEVWSINDFKLIESKINGAFPFSHYFYSGVAGSGVCVFSKYPITGAFFHQWSVNGYIHKVQHGDWFGGKGVGLCKIKVNDYNVSIYSAHLHAEYNKTCDEYQAHRVIQAFDTAQFIELTSAQADVVILAGDLNTEPNDLAYRILTSVTGMKDAYNEVYETAQEMMVTNEGVRNSYTDKSLVNKMFPGIRIDYIMYLSSLNVNVELHDYNHPLPDRVPGCNFSYSDHEAVSATLRISRYKEVPSRNVCDTVSTKSTLAESIAVCDAALAQLVSRKRCYWFFSAILFMLLITVAAMDIPFVLDLKYNIIRVVTAVLVTIAMIFTIIMASVWNMMETNGILAGKLEMEVWLRGVK